ncbi:MAG TPA: StlD/DarB family beta-ketosynthase [Bacteroidetes bacterium]|nr:StlD/DarB family beta-ketosynthase [Bacteroidota bacterium]
MNEVYINKISKFLPNKPVSNDEMEKRLGLINGNESINRGLILRSNQIKTRHYALDENGQPTHTNTQLAALAVKKLFNDNFLLEDVELLTAGTSSPDAIQPSHALMLHGELGGKKDMEVMSAHGTCNAAILSLKYAYMSIKSEQTSNAVCVGSETFGPWMHARNFEVEIDKRKELEKNPYIAFEKDFLRWMLSDGAAALKLENKPDSEGVSLRIDWIEITSFAHKLETCMYAGGEKDESGMLKGWKEMSEQEREEQSVFSLKQDARLLQNNIVERGGLFLQKLVEKHQLDISEIDYFLPHLSSMFFKKKIYDHLKKLGMEIPYGKWFYNLPKVGNIGAASAFFMMEELYNTQHLKKGQKILVMIPESARFSYSFVHLTVV